MESRAATHEEIANDLQRWKPRRMRFEHWTREFFHRNARNQAAHRRYSTSKVYWVDGVAHVRYLGDLHPLRANVFKLEDGQEIVSCWTLVAYPHNTTS